MKSVEIILKIESSSFSKSLDINVDKLIFVLSKLENNKNLKFKNIKQLEKLMKKYSLYNEVFLTNLNKL